MSLWNFPLRKPLVIAHRGGAALAPENTVEAFRAAEKAGADAVETDVRLTADGRLVCLHDADLARLCGDPRQVAACDLATLRDLLPHMMDLSEAIAASAPLGLLLDVKLTDTSALTGIIGAVREQGALPRTILGLRSEEMIAAARALDGEIAILSFLNDPAASRLSRAAGADWFRLWQGEATAERANEVRQAGLRLAVMVGQPRSEPLPVYPEFPVGLVDRKGLGRIVLAEPDAIMLDDPRLLRAD